MNIKRATLADLQEVSRLFDLYRQFYEQPADLDKARDYIEARLTNDESIVYLATDDEGRGLGFTQLYATFCSVAAAPIWILYDLYVDAGVRKGGVGTALMNRAKQLAEESGAVRIQLETAVDNTTAQSVYEALGYERDTAFYNYSLPIG
ncbi:MAG: GNAT family N-acetyltransferase [Gammaproteobacteria bacterium]|nr:GNAT family N-acetyltransferase [Gammaproteobacteria bacterium]